MKRMVKIKHLILVPAPLSFFLLCYAADRTGKPTTGKRAPTQSRRHQYTFLRTLSLFLLQLFSNDPYQTQDIGPFRLFT